MLNVNCPKCDFLQEASQECRRCGIVFERYKPRLESPTQPLASSATPAPGLFRRVFRIFRWLSLAGSVIAITLMLRQSPPPQVDKDPQAAQRTESKIQHHHLAARAGRPHALKFNEAELNSWLGSNLALARTDNDERSPVDATPAGDDPTLEQVQSSVRDVKIELAEDYLRAYVLFNLHGKDLSLLLEGRVLVENGYLRLQPSGGQLGSLPLPQGALKGAVDRLFDAPENKEKFRLPPEIADIRVDKGELIIAFRPRSHAAN